MMKVIRYEVRRWEHESGWLHSVKVEIQDRLKPLIVPLAVGHPAVTVLKLLQLEGVLARPAHPTALPIAAGEAGYRVFKAEDFEVLRRRHLHNAGIGVIQR